MSHQDIDSSTIDIADPPIPGLDTRYRPGSQQVWDWIAASNGYRPTPEAIGNDWLIADVAHYAAIWGARKMLQECRHWVGREVGPPAAEDMWQDLRVKSQI